MGDIIDWEGLSRWEPAELGRSLRRQGLSYGEIMNLIPVKKSTLATWCREVKLSTEQRAAIRKRTGSVAGLPRDTQRKRRLEVAAMRKKARSDAPKLVTQPLWVMGVALYWGEGAKSGTRLAMANSDPAALRAFLAWSRIYHGAIHGFAAKLNLHENNDELIARQWWASQLDLRVEDFTKTFIKPDGTGHRKNHLEHGVCLVRMRKSADALHRTLEWVDFLKDEYGS